MINEFSATFVRTKLWTNTIQYKRNEKQLLFIYDFILTYFLPIVRTLSEKHFLIKQRDVILKIMPHYSEAEYCFESMRFLFKC